MSVAGSTLTIVLTNTTSADAGDGGAGNLLAGLGFNLPTGATIGSGTVSMAGSIALGFTAPGDNDISDEWGYRNGIPTQGHFDPIGSGDGPATLTVNTVISSQKTDAPNQFSGTNNLKGPGFGLASPLAAVGGQDAIQDHVTITLNLSGTVPGDLIDQIDSNSVILAFGSPALSTIPEPTTLLLAILAMPFLGVRKSLEN